MKSFIKKRSVWLLIILNLITSYILFVSINKVDYLEEELSTTNVRLNTVLKNKRKQENIETTLMVAYDLSKPAAECYSYIFNNAANKYCIEWQYYGALVQVESRFNPTLTSKKECRGLTQISEDRGISEGKFVGVSYKKGITPWVESENLALGISFFSRLIIDSGYIDGIKGYNGGPSYKTAGYLNHNKAEIDSFYIKINKEKEKLTYIFKGVSAEDDSSTN